jgi:hypothetical protein
VALQPASSISSLASAFRAKPSTPIGGQTDAPPSRLLRPGSIVDIKV